MNKILPRKLSIILSIMFIIMMIVLLSCGKSADTKYPNYYDSNVLHIFNNVTYKIIIIDSCEYIIGRVYNGGYFLTHKGNCKFCKQRNK